MYGRQRRGGAPCRDVSWHPNYPVLASTSFDKTVKVWTLQSQTDEELRSIRERKAAEDQRAEKQVQMSVQKSTEPVKEKESDDDRMGGGIQIRGADAQLIRQIQMLMGMHGRDSDEEEEETIGHRPRVKSSDDDDVEEPVDTDEGEPEEEKKEEASQNEATVVKPESKSDKSDNEDDEWD